MLRTQKLSFGSHMTIPRGRWPAIFSRAFVIPAEDISPRLTDAYLDADALVLVHEGNCQEAQALPRQPLGFAS